MPIPVGADVRRAVLGLVMARIHGHRVGRPLGGD
jgi:hypothetical protein